MLALSLGVIMKNIRNAIENKEFEKFEKTFLNKYYSGDDELK